jgi:hypothetical protein
MMGGDRQSASENEARWSGRALAGRDRSAMVARWIADFRFEISEEIKENDGRNGSDRRLVNFRVQISDLRGGKPGESGKCQMFFFEGMSVCDGLQVIVVRQ